MSTLRLSAIRVSTPWRLALAVAALLLAGPVTWAQPGGYRGPPPQYKERPPQAPPPAVVKRPPVRYTITITFLPPRASPTKVARVKDAPARIVAHLPEGAPLWLADTPTRQRGMVRHFITPPLKRGQNYGYAARVVWFEDGQWVSQTKELPVRAGMTTCLFLTRPSAVADALNELSPTDRKLAVAQKFCAVQPENLLGAMGKPVKVVLKGQPVFLCCQDCVKQARRAPNQVLAKAKELRAKNDPPTKQ
jgi:uncharacterized protein (TIGR03000 family)